MSEQRFTVRRDEKGAILIPNSILKDGEIIDEKETVDLLNELAEENEKLRFLININSVSERRKLERQVDEQQATIRRLQDLCGESDGENAKLRIENKKLKEENDKLIQKNCIPCELVNLQTREIDKLKEENEQLRQILKDIVVATDETYTKNTSMFKVTVVLDYEKYMEIRRCIE